MLLNRLRLLAFGASLGAITLASAAGADIVTSLAAPPTQVSGGYAYTYNVGLGSSSQLDGTATTDRDGNSIINFGTIYDFGQTLGQISTTGLLTNDFAFTMNMVDPPAAFTAPTDDPSSANIRFTYTLASTLIYLNGQGFSDSSGTTNEIGIDPGVDNLGTFTVVSPYGPDTRTSNYDGMSYKSTNDTAQGNVGTLAVPAGTTSNVPEPAAWVLMIGGFGMIGAALRRERGPTSHFPHTVSN